MKNFPAPFDLSIAAQTKRLDAVSRPPLPGVPALPSNFYEVRKEEPQAVLGGVQKVGKRLMNVGELSNYLSIPVGSIYTMVSLGKIPISAIVHIGRALRFDLAEIDAWVNRQKASEEPVRSGV